MDPRDQSSSDLRLEEQVRNIRANAELVVRMFARETDFGFGYNRESVQWLDAYIEQIRKTERTAEEFNQLVSNLGSFLGEAIIRSFGGKWWFDQRGWAVLWDDFNLVYPFMKVAKQFRNGESYSIYSFFAVTGAMRKS